MFFYLTPAKNTFILLNEELVSLQRDFIENEKAEPSFAVFLSEKQKVTYEDMKKELEERISAN